MNQDGAVARNVLYRIMRRNCSYS